MINSVFHDKLSLSQKNSVYHRKTLFFRAKCSKFSDKQGLSAEKLSLSNQHTQKGEKPCFSYDKHSFSHKLSFSLEKLSFSLIN